MIMTSYHTIGAWKENGETHFRVWAPHAQKVDVLIQQGPQWDFDSETREEALSRETDGYWSVGLSGMTRFHLDNHNASVVVDPESMSWVDFDTPGFENFIIYQLHVGSFAGRNDPLGNKPVAGFADVAAKFGYIRGLGFNAIELLPVHEFAADRSWGYNPASFFAPESVCGSPKDLRLFVNRAHTEGLAVIFDVVYNHAGPGDNVLWRYDGSAIHDPGGIYFEGGQITSWGRGPAWWKEEVREFFFENEFNYRVTEEGKNDDDL